MSEVTRILCRIENGDPTASDELLPLVYRELRQLAAAKLSQEKAGQTLQPTALVHEAYLRLVDVDKTDRWNSRGHFFGAAAEAMRRILVEKARRRKREKHGGGRGPISIDGFDPADPSNPDQLLALDLALNELGARMPEVAGVVKLRYFGGLTVLETARAMCISERSVHRHWAYAKAWLYKQLAAH